MNLRAKSQKGFTIVELLIVIVVIAILAAISIVAYTGVQENARNTQRLSNAQTVIDAANAYNAENGAFPTIDQLKAYDTVNLSAEIETKLGSTATPGAAPTSALKDNIRYTPGTNSATVQYWGKASSGPDAVITLTAGS